MLGCLDGELHSASEDAGEPASTTEFMAEPSTRACISGYEAYELNQPMESSVLARFVGPKPDKTQPEYQVFRLREDYSKHHYVWRKDTILTLQYGLLKAIFVDYEPPKELQSCPEEAWPFVDELRQEILGQYDSELIAKDKFYLAPEAPGAKSWMGALQMKGERGRELTLIWTGERVMISCWEADILRETREEIQRESARELPNFPSTPSL